MKRNILKGDIALFVLLSFAIPFNIYSQDSQGGSKFSVGTDFYSNYVWRGTRYGHGPHIQPDVRYYSGGVVAGVWGSFDFNGYSEVDPYVIYNFPFGLSLGITDYYYPSLSLFEFSDSSGSHALDINTGYVMGGFTFSANVIVNKAGGAGSFGGDLYFQAGYAWEYVSIFAGAGNGWHTIDGNFNLCNIGIETGKTINITDTFSIPVTGQIIINPDRKQMFLVIGFTF
ncbi:MAG TPA: hypothetical protein VMV47_05340 [Bacteroidales bacterium]|nr:hypothetical protein [Bacteroidales bacterium]